MGFNWKSGEDVASGSTFLEQPGDYHMLITKVDYPALKHDGSMNNEALFDVHCSVLAGSTPNQENKTIKLTFYPPNLQSKDNGKFARKKVDRFLIAVGLMEPSDVGKELDINIEEADMRQFCVRLEKQSREVEDRKTKKKEMKEFVTIRFADIFHVDDPDAAVIPKDNAALNVIPSLQRRVGMKSLSATAKPAAKDSGEFDF
jgi:hypothetical protein